MKVIYAKNKKDKILKYIIFKKKVKKSTKSSQFRSRNLTIKSNKQLSDKQNSF